MVMLAGWRIGVDDAQTAGHAQVDQQAAGIKVQQQVFCPSLDGTHTQAAQGLGKMWWHPPAQAVFPYHDIVDGSV
ncbi:hypothetical protein THUN1379_27570 [Paludibacterium sp. THUN1379]|nr:hypothetical protein THUN1379_27570 [Paludibacterium sp. THUN1379]